MPKRKICKAEANGRHLIPKYGTTSLICTLELNSEGKHEDDHLSTDDVRWTVKDVRKAKKQFRNES